MTQKQTQNGHKKMTQKAFPNSVSSHHSLTYRDTAYLKNIEDLPMTKQSTQTLSFGIFITAISRSFSSKQRNNRKIDSFQNLDIEIILASQQI